MITNVLPPSFMVHSVFLFCNLLQMNTNTTKI